MTTTKHEQVLRPNGFFAVVAIVFFGVAAIYAGYTVFSRSLSIDEGYLMITIQSFLEGNALYDSIFTHYGPFYYAYEWILHGLLSLPLTHDATRMLCIVHWLTVAVMLGFVGGIITRSAWAGLFVFTQAVIHLTALANEPGHPQELIVMLLAIGMLVATAPRIGKFSALAVITAALVLTKINVGIFFGLALLLAMRCHSTDRFARGPWTWLVVGGAAMLPFLLMRPHLAAEWCRNYSLIVAGTIAATLLVATRFSDDRSIKWLTYLRVAICFVVAGAIVLAIAVLTGTLVSGLIEGLFLTPLKMPGVALLPLPVPTGALLNTAAAVILAIAVAANLGGHRITSLVPILKAVYGIAGSLCLLGDAKAQIAYLLPWVWLVLVRLPTESQAPTDSFPRVLLCLAATWQSLQAYPIAGTQVATATVLLIITYTVCLRDAFESLVNALRRTNLPSFTGFRQLPARTLPCLQTLGVVVLLYLFTNVWCNLPTVRRHYAELPPLGLAGSRFVHTDTEVTVNYRALTQYLENHCDTFVTYPGINSLYFWTGKRPPTHLNSTGWGQLSHQQQEQILFALTQAKRPMLVVVAPAVQGWVKSVPPQISPLVRFVFQNCREVKRIGGYILFVPKPSSELAVAAPTNEQ